MHAVSAVTAREGRRPSGGAHRHWHRVVAGALVSILLAADAPDPDHRVLSALPSNLEPALLLTKPPAEVGPFRSRRVLVVANAGTVRVLDSERPIRDLLTGVESVQRESKPHLNHIHECG